MPVNISGLDDTLEAINFLTAVVERGTGATAIEKGVGEQKNQTLGEVEILVGKAVERSTNIAKFYRRSWYDFARKWYKLMKANARGKKELFRTGQSGKLYSKTVYRSDWVSEAGFEPIVRSSSEQEQDNVKAIQKWQFLLNMFPTNPALRRIAEKRALEIVDLTPDELKEVEDAEKQMEQAAQMAQQVQPQASPNAVPIQSNPGQLQPLNV